MKYPLISCLCATRSKPNFLNRAINCFLNQTYPNKELVVIYDDDDELTKEKIKTFDYFNVIFFEVERNKMTLGDIRNYSVEKSSGDYVCQWDDDDWHHPERIKYQYEIIIKKKYPACVLTQWMLFDGTTNKAYVSHRRMWEGSILCKKEQLLNLKYDKTNKGEDTSVIEKLLSEDKIYLINDSAELYIYQYHGQNTWNYNHWKKIFNCSYELSGPDSKKIKKILNNYTAINHDFQLVDSIMKNYRNSHSKK